MDFRFRRNDNISWEQWRIAINRAELNNSRWAIAPTDKSAIARKFIAAGSPLLQVSDVWLLTEPLCRDQSLMLNGLAWLKNPLRNIVQHDIRLQVTCKHVVAVPVD